ncbi:MAG TPA: hypothetical protein VF457_14775, partial [Burkholderiaceae bacterium]
ARAAIRDAARGSHLAERGDALTHEEDGSTIPVTDGPACDTCNLRHLAAPAAAAPRLAHNVAKAVKADCMKQASTMGLLALPVIVATEAAGTCNN